MMEAVREERERLGLRLEDLAARVPCSASTLSRWERGLAQVPEDAVPRLVHALSSVRLGQLHCWDCAANPFPVPVLDRVDSHPVVCQGKTGEELSEALDALRMVVLYNKPGRDQLSNLDRGLLEKAAAELVDLLPAIHLMLQVLAERYGIEPWSLALGLYRKCRERGYTSLGPPAAARYWPQERRWAA